MSYVGGMQNQTAKVMPKEPVRTSAKDKESGDESFGEIMSSVSDKNTDSRDDKTETVGKEQPKQEEAEHFGGKGTETTAQTMAAMLQSTVLQAALNENVSPAKQQTVSAKLLEMTETVGEAGQAQEAIGQAVTAGDKELPGKVIQMAASQLAEHTEQKAAVQIPDGQGQKAMEAAATKPQTSEIPKTLTQEANTPVLNSKLPEQQTQAGSLETAQEAARTEAGEPKILVTGRETEKTETTDLAAQGSNEPVQQGDTIRIKVAEPYHTVNHEFAEEVSDTLKQSIAKGTTEYNIQLEPENLGKIMIKIAFSRDGANVELTCTNPRTLTLLTENAKEVGAIVENHTGNQVTVQVRQEETPYWNQSQHHGGGGQNQEDDREGRRESKKSQEDETVDFVQQLRLGLFDGTAGMMSEAI